jgi:hypothetical protein
VHNLLGTLAFLGTTAFQFSHLAQIQSSMPSRIRQIRQIASPDVAKHRNGEQYVLRYGNKIRGFSCDWT